MAKAIGVAPCIIVMIRLLSGNKLLEKLPEIEADHAVVLEMSSFQLENLAAIGLAPAAGLVTNLQPNHLDRHGTLEAYGEAKKARLTAWFKAALILGCRSCLIQWDVFRLQS